MRMKGELTPPGVQNPHHADLPTDKSRGGLQTYSHVEVLSSGHLSVCVVGMNGIGKYAQSHNPIFEDSYRSPGVVPVAESVL